MYLSIIFYVFSYRLSQQRLKYIWSQSIFSTIIKGANIGLKYCSMWHKWTNKPNILHLFCIKVQYNTELLNVTGSKWKLKFELKDAFWEFHILDIKLCDVQSDLKGSITYQQDSYSNLNGHYFHQNWQILASTIRNFQINLKGSLLLLLFLILIQSFIIMLWIAAGQYICVIVWNTVATPL